MDIKTTQELINELTRSNNIHTYLDENNAQLLDMDLKSYLEQLLSKKGVSKKEAIARSGLHEIYAYQIFAGRKSPSRDKILSLCFGMYLSVEETQHLLNMSGSAGLYPRNRRDSIILFALEKGLSAMECDELLYELNEYTLQ